MIYLPWPQTNNFTSPPNKILISSLFPRAYLQKRSPGISHPQDGLYTGSSGTPSGLSGASCSSSSTTSSSSGSNTAAAAAPQRSSGSSSARRSRFGCTALANKMAAAGTTQPVQGWPNTKDDYELREVIGESWLFFLVLKLHDRSDVV